MQKMLIVVGDKELEVAAESFSVDYNKYKGYDTIITIVTSSPHNENEGGPGRQFLVAEGVGRPTSQGVLVEPLPAMKLDDLLEKQVVDMYRKGNNIQILSQVDDSKYDVVTANFLVETARFSAVVHGSFNNCVQSFFALEKQISVDPNFKVQRYLVIIEAPQVLMDSSNEFFKMQEVVTILKRKSSGKIIVQKNSQTQEGEGDVDE